MIHLQNIVKSFPGVYRPVLDSLNLHIQPDDFCVILGANGSGKSTLMKLIAGDFPPESGSIIYSSRAQIAMVVQDNMEGTVPQMTLLENISLCANLPKRRIHHFYHREEQSVLQILRDVDMGLEEYLHQPLSRLSGGQRQMVATIMALQAKPNILLLDEHTSALDPAMQHRVMDYTNKSIVENDLTTLMITHSLQDALSYGNRLIVLQQGQVSHDFNQKQKQELTLESLKNLFFEGNEGDKL